MKKFGKSLIGLVLVVGLLAIFTGACVQDIITPCHISEDVIKYSGIEPTSYAPWTTVWDAKRVRDYMNFNHVQYQNACERLKQDDSLSHAFLLGSLNVTIADATAFQKQVFSPTSAIGLAFPALFAGTFCSLFVSKPSDKKKITELETKLNGNNVV